MKDESAVPEAVIDSVHAEEANVGHNGEEAQHSEKRGGLSGDIAAQLVDDIVAVNITPEQDKAVLRRVDCFLMPVMFISFAFQYMDKACLTGASLFGILTDLKLLEV
jgi:hypothetical protein